MLNYACRNVADSAACSAGFLQAVRANNNQPSIPLLALYSTRFFSDTQYSSCIDIIEVSYCSVVTFYHVFVTYLNYRERLQVTDYVLMDIATSCGASEERIRKFWLDFCIIISHIRFK